MNELVKARLANDEKLYTEKKNQIEMNESNIKELFIKAGDKIRQLQAQQ